MRNVLKLIGDRRQILGYPFALAATAAAIGVRMLLSGWLSGDAPTLLLIPAIVSTAWYAGFRPGLFATALCVLAGIYFFVDPPGWAVERMSDQLRLALFGGVGVLISWLLELTHRQRNRIDEERERLRVTLASIGDGVIRTDLRGRVAGLNGIASELTGWSEEEAVGRPLTEVVRIVDETTRQPVDHPALRALREGCIVDLANHTLLIAKDGTERPIADRAAPIRDADGQMVGAVLVFRDVAGERRAAKALRSIDARRAAMLDSALDGIVAIDGNGTVIDFNPAAERIFGYSRAEVVGREMAELIIPPSLRSAHREGIARFSKTGEARIRNQRIELPAIRADGTEFPAEVSIAPASVDETTIFIGFIRDISERKQAERERAFFVELAAATQPLEDPAEVTQTAARLLAEHLGVDRCAYAEVEDEQDFVITGDYGRGVASIVGRWPVEDFGAECLRSMLANEAYVVEDSEADPCIGPQDVPAYRATSIRSMICVPLLKRGRFTAAMAVHQKTVRRWTEHEILFVRTVVARCWEALQRSRVVRQLRDSEERYRSLVTATAAIVWNRSAAGEFETPQPGWSEYTGQTFAELRGQGWLDAVHPDDRAETADVWNHARASSSQYVVEHRLRRADGEYRDMSVRAVPILDASGRVREWIGVHTDITARKAAEQAVFEAQERLTTTLAAAEVGTWELDAAADRVVADAQLARLFSISAEAALAGETPLSRFTAAIHPDDRERVQAAIGRSLETGEPYEVEYRLQQPDRSTRWVIARGARPREGRLSGVLIDVTARKLAEEALRTSEERYRTLFETMDEGFCVAEVIFDEKGRAVDYRFIEANPAFEKHSGLSNVVGKTAGELVPGHETYWAEIYGQVVRTGQAVRFVNEARMLNRWFDVNAFRIGGPGSVRVAQLFTDITERKRIEQQRQEHEERFRNLVEQVEDYAIFMIDREGRPTSWNEGVRRVLGFAEEEFLNQDIRAIFTPEDDAAGVPEQELADAATTGRANDDRWMRRKDGTRFYATGVTHGLKDDDGELLGYMKVMRDQTARKQMEDELRRVAADLSEADRRKNEFLATLAHELRNPLAPIRSGLELMKLTGDDPQETAEIRDVMERQAQQMMRLIDDLLEVARITQGKLELRTATVALADVVRSAVDASRPFIDEGGHELIVSVPPEPIRLLADPHRLQQVFSNLLNNAAKYTPDGGRIELTAALEEGGVAVCVRDNGIGIPAEMKDRIFEMFAQIDRSMERSYSGLGIGLTLVKRLVEMHGGRIEVHSEGRNQGSEFIVHLPTEAARTERETTDERPATEAPAGGLRVLVVDDNRPAADILAKVIRLLGNEARTAYDGREGVAAADEFRPEVILMDLGMPNMNGYEATRQIRRFDWGGGITIVALTGWGQDEDRRRTQEAGFDRHLVKPVEPSTLQKLLAETKKQSTG